MHQHVDSCIWSRQGTEALVTVTRALTSSQQVGKRLPTGNYSLWRALVGVLEGGTECLHLVLPGGAAAAAMEK